MVFADTGSEVPAPTRQQMAHFVALAWEELPEEDVSKAFFSAQLFSYVKGDSSDIDSGTDNGDRDGDAQDVVADDDLGNKENEEDPASRKQDSYV